LRASLITLCAALGALSTVALANDPPLPPDGPMGSKSLPQPWSRHWVWVNDFVFPHMTDGMAYLVDGDSGAYLGTLSTGASFNRVLVPAAGEVMYSPETYFSRGTRGERTDVVTLYDRKNLSAVGEILIPPKRASNLPMMADAALTDDDRFLLIYNFNPAQSVTVVDTRNRSFVGEIETAGCALVYPTGPRSFFSICGDGAALAVELSEGGTEVRRSRSEPLFEVASDPVSEKGVRYQNTWLFASFGGDVYPVIVDGHELKRGERWSLTTAAERKGHWRPGGLQHLALHAGRAELYSIMHQGGLSTHKDPGSVVFVYDLKTRTRTRRITLKSTASAIALSGDDQPLLFSMFIDSNTLDVYDPASGRHLRAIEHIGTTPALLVSIP
jgi:methylamine dehydrogenase heavy chain